MKKISPQRIAQALYELTIDQDKKDVVAVVDRFINWLAGNRQLSQASAIIAAFDRYADRQAGVVSATVTTATKLSAVLRHDIIALIKKQTVATTVELDEQTNEALLGGFSVAVDDLRIDASLKQKVADLHHHLIS